MHEIRFETSLYDINTWQILRFPMNASKELPSRGMVMVSGTMNGIPFEAPLEPDGMGSHWFRVSDALSNAAQADVGDRVFLEVSPMKDWFEPDVPLDVEEALTAAGALHQWNRVTVRARWEWLRWIRFTSNAATRQKRIEATCSMLQSGKKRPCCFDLSRCTETSISKNGVLLALE
ncbi:MAG: YdeI/OmpD-associated family protein [Bacillota bacterium]|nr:YdeI/OmpD-associated family protein [Bacillota bacterium]MDW7676791.1 YdeI/OmpD-associated family protein [Bacillota bacterium]